MSKNSFLMQFYEINSCQVITFRLYTKHEMIKIWQSNERKITHIIASARIISLPTVRVVARVLIPCPLETKRNHNQTLSSFKYLMPHFNENFYIHFQSKACSNIIKRLDKQLKTFLFSPVLITFYFKV